MISITKRGNFWCGQIIRRGYSPQYGTFDTRSQAEAWERALENEMDRGIFSQELNLTGQALSPHGSHRRFKVGSCLMVTDFRPA
jgi:hypothetical protein